MILRSPIILIRFVLVNKLKNINDQLLLSKEVINIQKQKQKQQQQQQQQEETHLSFFLMIIFLLYFYYILN